MATIAQIRGALLEEIVIYLLQNVGYTVVSPGEPGTKRDHSGLKVQGRGEWHQVDALVKLEHNPPFIYPLRLVVEAKCYKKNPVGIEVPRNLLGLISDISQNYFSYYTTPQNDELQIQRFNYLAAVFSTSGYTREAQRFAIAHQIFLIQYENVPLLSPITEQLLAVNHMHFINKPLSNEWNIKMEPGELTALRLAFRDALKDPDAYIITNMLTEEGSKHLSSLAQQTKRIRGSYFGMLQGKYPMHLLTEQPLPPGPFSKNDEVRCRLSSIEPDRWYFSPVNVYRGDSGYFELEFDLPLEIASIIQKQWHDFEQVANVKRSYFSYINLSGMIGGIKRQVRLVLDEDWLQKFLDEARKRRRQFERTS